MGEMDGQMRGNEASAVPNCARALFDDLSMSFDFSSFSLALFWLDPSAAFPAGDDLPEEDEFTSKGRDISSFKGSSCDIFLASERRKSIRRQRRSREMGAKRRQSL